MRQLRLIAVALLCLAGCGPGEETYAPNEPTPYNVVLVTLDGVRWQELFLGADPVLGSDRDVLFPKFFEKIAPRGELYGDPREGSDMLVSTSANASLPGYMSIFAEHEQSCLTNHCGRIEVDTFVDRLHDELELNKKDVAVFASWKQVGLAISSRDDVAMVEAGARQYADEDAHPMRRMLDPAFQYDRPTVMDGMLYLTKIKPRFFYLSLLDSDRYAHQGKYAMVEAVLEAYDRTLAALVEALDKSGEYGRNTALIVTTDHGRGLLEQWSDHGPQTPASANVWAFVMLPPSASELELEKPTARTFNHHDVRYTIEALFGLGTTSRGGFSTGFVRSDASGHVR